MFKTSTDAATRTRPASEGFGVPGKYVVVRRAGADSRFSPCDGGLNTSVIEADIDCCRASLSAERCDIRTANELTQLLLTFHVATDRLHLERLWKTASNCSRAL